MHTVIILNKHASNLLREHRYLFQPFVSDGTISFCEWNELGTDIKTSVPDLYKSIQGKTNWRAMIVSTNELYGKRTEPVSREDNPFDFPDECEKDTYLQESNIPIVRLTHMLCGYPTSTIKDFEEGYEYIDNDTGQVCRVRVSELTENRFFELLDQYKEEIKPIYMEVKCSKEEEKKRKQLEELYSFVDVRPQEVYLISTRRHLQDERHIYKSWTSPIEIESSDFCRRNNYPVGCRFLCHDITNPENSLYLKELTQFWLAILTVAVNPIPASTLQAYKLYHLDVNVSQEELSRVLNRHLNQMEAALEFVQKRLRMKNPLSVEEEDAVVAKQNIPVIYEESIGRELYINTNKTGLCRDCPSDELEFWNNEMREKKTKIDRFLKMPRRAIDRASIHVKERANTFFDETYELDRFQVEDLEDELDALELEVLTSDTRSILDEKKMREEMHQIDLQVKKNIAIRMRKRDVIFTGLTFLFVYFLGFVPYLYHCAKLGMKTFSASFGVVLAAIFVAATGGVLALFILRRQLRKKMEKFNDLMHELVLNVNGCGKKFEYFFSTLCTYMKAQSIYEGLTKKCDAVSERTRRLRMHKNALQNSIGRDEELIVAFQIKRNADFERNITRFFHEDKLPRENHLYYYELDGGKTEIPLNTTGDLIHTPYKFVVGLSIEREDLYEETKGEDL